MQDCPISQVCPCLHAQIPPSSQPLLIHQPHCQLRLFGLYISRLCPLLCLSSSSSDVFLWNVMIRGFVDLGFYDRAIFTYKQMLELGISPDNYTFPFVIKACGCVCDFELGVKLHQHVVEHGYDTDVFVGNSLVAMYGKCGRFKVARQVFEKIPEKNVVSWSSMIGAYAQNRCFEEGLSLFARMLDEGIRPHRVSVLNVMACVYRENDADEICRVVRDNKLDLDKSVQNAAMQMYARCRRIDVARGFLIEFLLKQMIVQRVHPDAVTLMSVIHACSSLSSFQHARFVHGLIVRSFFRNQLELQTALVDLYVKCGSLVYARKVFDKMKERNIISWSTMISGYGMHGFAGEALKLFDQMKALVKPDHITFLSVLSACSHCGFIEEGWECFNSMNRDFKVIPRPEHYACMVDLLGRAGKLNDALDFIQRMPILPDAENPGRYVLMSNIYASSGKQKHADEIRDLMKLRGVRKTAGHTVIEIKNKVYTFVAGDKSHHQSDLIYSELEKVMNRIRVEGYKPDLKFVLHNVEEEMKEKMLYVHSEKLAIVLDS
ncbi:hypothetical protein FNV43_RR04617 [Rhamnella rubrinervis]|uniref:DYW domain-containing protein n=1 Tax=Rhamnella rubrinervis TaxID=2594499 RepID=A0A8K0HM45_9ROSA|nr:hypothetical protein FNV43_RR04617 [Rhamnella rubrinervis]